MTLERKLAEIQVLTKSLSPAAHLEYRTFCQMDDAWKGIQEEPKAIYEKYILAKKAISNKDFLEAGRYISEFCLDAKNLADNMSIFLQSLYGTETPHLKKLHKNISRAPLTKDGKSLAEVIESVHDYSKESILVSIRNMKGHRKGSSILVSSDTPSGFRLCFEDSKGIHRYGEDALTYLNTQVESYLEMAKTVLEAVVNKELIKRDMPGKTEVYAQMIKNFAKRHKKPAMIALASALVASGAIGTLAYQRITEKNKALDNANTIRNVITSAYLESTENWAADLGENKFEEVKKRLEERAKLIGNTLSNNVESLRSVQNKYLQPEIVRDIEDFNRKRQIYLASLPKLRFSEGFSGAISGLNNLYIALDTEKELIEKEKLLAEDIGVRARHAIPYSPNRRK